MSAAEAATVERGPARPAFAGRRTERTTAILAYAGMALMLVGLVDPLEGLMLILPGALLATMAAFRIRHALRWVLAVAVVTLLMVAASMTQVPLFWSGVLIRVWGLGELALVVLGAFVARTVLLRGRPGWARGGNIAIALLALLAVVSTGRLVVLPPEAPATARETDTRWHTLTTTSQDGVQLSLVTTTFWGPQGTPVPTQPISIPTPGGLTARAVFRNASDKVIELPPDTVLDVVARNRQGVVVMDAAERFWGSGGRIVMPWDGPTLLVPDGQTVQDWQLPLTDAGTYAITAEVRGGPFDGLKTETVVVEGEKQP